MLASPAWAAEPVSFRNEVMAVLSRAGCNQGTCHGNQAGKGGFKLSLRGQDPEADFRALTRDMLARRVDPLRPDDSLILGKPLGIVPHEGGKRFAAGSLEHGILRRWLSEGMRLDSQDAPHVVRLEATPAVKVLVEPEESIPLRITAHFSDGRTRDVTRLAVYEPSNLVASIAPDGVVSRQQSGEVAILVRYLDRQATVQLAFVPSRPDFAWPKGLAEDHLVDRHVFAKLRTLRLLPSEPAPDHVFLRRLYLDLLGILPTAAEARAFLQDPRSDKRERLIDLLLERPEFADFWALKWSDLLRNEEKVLDRKGVQLFHDWIRQVIVERKPLNEFAREILAARGSSYSHPAANYYRALREPDARAETTAQVFLGIRIQCARCHNHPFDRWTQEDYHRLAAFFARVQYRIVENNRTDRLDKHEFDGEQIVWMAREGDVTHPRTGETLLPRFPGQDRPACDADADRLQVLADWVARPDNPFFARAQVNRVWQHLLGRGIVDPNDDFRASNPPVNGPLLDALTRDFALHNFDLRHLVRRIVTSRTYQLSAVPNATNAEDDANFARAQMRPLQAEQLLDAVGQLTGAPIKFPGFPQGMRAGQLPGAFTQRERGKRATDGEKFLTAFGKPVRSLSCECERSEDTTLNQAFQLLSGPVVNGMLREEDNRLGRMLASGKPLEALIEELYLSALCRLPSAAEKEKALLLLSHGKDRRAALEDLTWALIGSKEFLMRR
jgi:hypothetical protein